MTLDEGADNIGSLVVYEDATFKHYGLIQSVNKSCIFVRFHLGDTAEGCEPSSLKMLVPALKPSVEQEVARRVALVRAAPVLTGETYNKLQDFLLNTVASRSAILLAGEIGNQIGAARQRAAGL